jgi:hypothetical protein
MAESPRPSFIERATGIVAALAFVAGVILHVAILLGDQPTPFSLVAFFVTSATSLVYFQISGWRSKLPINIEGEVDVTPVLWALPLWAGATSIGLLGYSLFVGLSSIAPEWTAALLGETVGDRIADFFKNVQTSEDRALLAGTIGFTTFDFICASYCLARTRVA